MIIRIKIQSQVKLLKSIRASTTIKKSSIERSNRAIAGGTLRSQSSKIGGYEVYREARDGERQETQLEK